MAAFSVGQQKKKNDLQIGYAFLREEQDAAISSWGESDQRAPTNILQHRFYGLWRGAPHTTPSFTWGRGRTFGPHPPNTALAARGKSFPPPRAGVLVSGSRGQETWLN